MKTKVIFIGILMGVCFIAQCQSKTVSKAFADSIINTYNNITKHNFIREAQSALKAYRYFMNTGDSCRAIRAASLLSIAHDATGKLDSGLVVMLEAQKLFSKKCDPFVHANYILNLTNLYLSYDDPVKVEALCREELKVWTNPKGPATYYGLLTNCAIAEAYQGNLVEALQIFRQIRNESAANGHQEDELDAMLNLGSLKGMMGSLDSSHYYLKAAYLLYQEIDCEVEGIIVSNMAACLSDLNRRQEALIWYSKGKEIAKRENDLQLLVSLVKNEAKCQFQLNNFKEAWALILEHDELKDSLLDIEKVSALAEVQEKYESQLKTQKIQELQLRAEKDALEKDRLTLLRNFLLVAGIFSLLLAIGLWSRLRYVRKMKKLIQQERDISEAMLLNILPEEIAQELKEKGKAEARDFDLVSILFTDFKGFTEQSAKLSAADLVNEINHCFEAFDGIMEKYGIEKIKTIGDAYMAAGGLPVPTDTSVKNTVLAALEMQNFVTQRKAQNETEGKPAFEMRVGIHTGPVVAGIVGVKKFQYDIWGDTVNTASRMESAGEVGKVNISHYTYQLLKNDPDFAFESRGKIEAKGKGEMEMWFIKNS